MSNDEVPVGRLVTVIVGVLAASLIVSLGGLVLLGAADGDPEVRETLTHLIETVIGVFIGIVAGRLASGE
ncbi:MAG TPA: hypothetical protein VFK32_07535 [Tepidiformaceae bacterium]|nr:hypothetical protein [Tepidiformaceae bacterium]